MAKDISLNFKLLSALVFLCALSVQNPTAAVAKAYRFGAWHVKLRHDRFTAVNYCNLYGNQMTFDHNVVYFKFQRNVDTESAWYRFDGGEAAPISNFKREVAQLTPFPEHAPLENPGNAEAPVPANIVKSLGFVEIRPNERARVKHFRVDGLTQALAFMGERDCVTFQK